MFGPLNVKGKQLWGSWITNRYMSASRTAFFVKSEQKRLVQAWAELHIDELKTDWALAMNGEPVFKIEPLS